MTRHFLDSLFKKFAILSILSINTFLVKYLYNHPPNFKVVDSHIFFKNASPSYLASKR